MPAGPLMLVDDAEGVRAALTPIRRQLLERLQQPGSAASLAADLGMSRQKVGYHLQALERAGLVTLHEERQRRGFTERLFVASARSFVVDPGVIGESIARDGVETQDRHAASHLVQAAATLVRDVARMRAAAEAEDRRLLTFAIEADVAFARPEDFEAFTDALAAATADLVRRFDAPDGGRRYHLLIGGHPAAASSRQPPVN